MLMVRLLEKLGETVQLAAQGPRQAHCVHPPRQNWDPFWEPKSTQNPKGVWEKSVLFSILWSVGPKMAAKTVPRGSKSPQERPKTPPRPSQEVPKPPKSSPRPSKEGPRAPKSGIRSPNLQFWSRLGVRFVDSSHGFDQ